jgi:RimJ/RimL family protein N-acetyltransferase
MIPVLETERLRLRAPAKTDFPVVLAFLTSDRTKYIGGPYDPARAWSGFAASTGTWILDGYGYWAVETREDRTLVGAVGFQGPPRFQERELGWDLYGDNEGRGYATEAARAARDWAYGPGGFDTIVSYVDPHNARSIAVAERLGCTRDAGAWRPDPEDIVFRHPRPEALP